jgi:hypothetical protein
MKPIFHQIVAIVTVCRMVTAADSTQELRDALLARGDFNGDGQVDVAVVERATGLLRIALAAADGSLTWIEANHTGIAPATGLATGKFLIATRDSLAVTGTDSNRTNVFDLSKGASLPVPLTVFSSATGPTGVSAAQVANGSALEEMVIHYTENGSPAQARAFVRFSGNPVASQTFTPASPAPAVPSLELRPRRLEGMASAAVGSFDGAEPTETFKVMRVGSSPIQAIASLPGLPSGSQWVHADFDGATTPSPAQFVFFARGSSALMRTALSASNSFSAIATSETGGEIEHVTAVAKADGGWSLLVVYEAGWAQLFSYNGTSAPVPGEVFPTPKEGSYRGAFASGPGDFHLLSGPPGSALANAHRFTWNGSSHAANGISRLPELRAARASANIFAFSKDPFIASDAVLLGSFAAGEWTREGSLGGGNLQVQQARFSGAADGLGDFSPVSLGTPPPGTTYVMTNQIASGQAGVASYASAYGPTRALGHTIGEVTIDPPSGRMLRSIRPHFTAPPGVSVFWRIGGGAWVSLAVQPPGWQFEAFTIQWYGHGANDATTPIFQAAYTFAEPPDMLDSDGDGIPDYVEIARGLDPVRSGDDGDSDGASDLVELLSGTDPTNAASAPTRPGGPPAGPALFDSNFQNTFNFRIAPNAIAGSSRYATLGAESAGIGLYDLASLPLGLSQTVGANPQQARIGNIQAGYGGSLLVAATDANFDLTAGVPNKRRGREVVGLIPVPTSRLGPVPHAYAGGPLPAALASWVNAARNHYDQPVPPITHTLDATTTLTLLLVELKYQEILRARGELGSAQTLSLTPFRPTEVTYLLEEQAAAPSDAVFRLSAADLDRMRRFAGEPPGFAYPTGWRAEDIHHAIVKSLGAAAPSAIERLVRLTREIYFLSAAASDQVLPQFPSPVDTLRRFLRTARLPGDTNANGVREPGETESYWGNLSLTPADVSTAHSAIASLLAAPPSRPIQSSVFVVDADTFASPVAVVRDISTLAPHVLLQGNGEPWPLAQFAPLTVGAELAVTGFTDVTSPDASNAVEVITLSLTKLPSVSPDLDNDLLGDGWQELFPGTGADGPFTDTDGDGASDLQEYLDGTDPTDPASISPGGPVSLLPPPLIISQGQAPGTYQIQFHYPPAYADRIAFHIQQSNDLESGFSDTGTRAPHLGSGNHRILLNPAAANAKFWRVRLSLK